MSLASFGVRKPVIANLVMLTIVAAGVIFGVGLRREFFPEIRPTEVTIRAPYPGASPEEIEESLAKKIEDRVADLDDVKEINTTIVEGMCSVLIEFNEGVDIAQKVFDVKSEMDALEDLPEASKRIVVEKFEPNFPTINVSLYGDADERVMKQAISEIRDDLRSLPGMGQVVTSGVRTDEITVAVRPDALIEHHISLPAVSDQIHQAMLELPGGSVKSDTANVSVRTMGADERSEAVRRIIVKAGSEGQVVRVGDIADVRSGFEDVDWRVRLNGKPAVSLTVYKVGKEDAVRMAEMVKAYVAGRNHLPIKLTLAERIKKTLMRDPPLEKVSDRLEAYELGLSRPQALPGTLTTTTDLARFIVGRLELLSRNALQGGVLVVLTLILLLNLRVAFWVAAGLVVSLLGTLAVMHFAGVSLNLLTMFGLIVVVGMLVDDAIVVAENITARHEMGEPALDAAVNGTHQVGWPVVATVLTTVAAFLPLTLIEGRIGDLLAALPIVVSCALVVSLLEALFILPSHMGHSLIRIDRTRQRGHATRLGRLEARLNWAREGFFHRAVVPNYLKALRACQKYRYITLFAAISIVVISWGLVAGGRVPFTFIKSADAETINIQLKMPVGTPIDETDSIVKRLEHASLAQPEVTSCFSIAGSLGSMDGSTQTDSPHLAQLILELKPVEQRQAAGMRRSDAVITAIRNDVGELPGVESLRMDEVSGGPGGPPISLAVVGDSPAGIQRVAHAIGTMLGDYKGVYDVADDNDRGRRELRLRLLPGANELGFTTENLARQIRGAFYGLEAHTFAGDREDVDVRVIMPEDVRRSLTGVEHMYVFTPKGDPVPLSEVVDVEQAQGYATIKRLDRHRVVTVSAQVDQAIQNPEAVTAELWPKIRDVERQNPGIHVIERGRQQDVKESFQTLPLGMLVACGLIYVILAWLFSSYIQPLIVMTAIPFATIGMIWGHFLLGYDLMMLSLIGFVALAGVVVNDSLIFMEFFNEKRAEGFTVRDAGLAAGQARIRAILLTTITTVFGLLPLMMERSFQAKFLIPMAITISCGLISATLIILVVLPCMLMVLDDVGRLARWLWTGGRTPLIDPSAQRPGSHSV